MPRMKQLEKLDGFGNVQMVEVERPEPGPGQMLVEVKRSLISRGSELFRRYILEEVVSPDIMGYSDAGEIVAIGPDVENFSVGQRVMVNGPHAQYVLANASGRRKRAFALPDDLTYEAATFLPLTTSSIMWMRTSPIEPGQTTQDGKFTLMTTECLGSCGTAPCALLNETLHENLTAQNVENILDSLE